MIKVDVRNMTAERVEMPAALDGLEADTLQNLQSRLNPVPPEFVGVEFWPEVDFAPPIDYTTHKLGAEVLTPDLATKTVKVSYQSVPLTPEEITALRKARTPHSVTMRQATQALILAGLDDDVDTLLAQMPGTAGKLARAEWAKSQVVERDRQLVIQLGSALGLDDAAIDQLFITAATL